jgi:hypothetical protein
MSTKQIEIDSETSRIRAALVNSGLHTFPEAEKKLAASRLSIVLGAEAAGTHAGQAAFLTATIAAWINRCCFLCPSPRDHSRKHPQFLALRKQARGLQAGQYGSAQARRQSMGGLPRHFGMAGLLVSPQVENRSR